MHIITYMHWHAKKLQMSRYYIVFCSCFCAGRSSTSPTLVLGLRRRTRRTWPHACQGGTGDVFPRVLWIDFTIFRCSWGICPWHNHVYMGGFRGLQPNVGSMYRFSATLNRSHTSGCKGCIVFYSFWPRFINDYVTFYSGNSECGRGVVWTDGFW
jgi:hypothetical protein